MRAAIATVLLVILAYTTVGLFAERLSAQWASGVAVAVPLIVFIACAIFLPRQQDH